MIDPALVTGLEKLRESLKCRHDTTHYCPNCDNHVPDLEAFDVLDAAIRALAQAPAAPQTCATCKFWANHGPSREGAIEHGWDAPCDKAKDIKSMFVIYVRGDGVVGDYDFDTPPTFSCGFHELIAPRPASAGREE